MILLDLCAALDPGFEDLREASEVLTPYSVAARYPGRGPDPSAEEAEAAHGLATQVAGFVDARLCRADPP